MKRAAAFLLLLAIILIDSVVLCEDKQDQITLVSESVRLDIATPTDLEISEDTDNEDGIAIEEDEGFSSRGTILARVNEQEYESVEEALSSAAAGDTVEILGGETVISEGIYYASAILVKGDSILTITGGTFQVDEITVSSDNATLSIMGGLFSNNAIDESSFHANRMLAKTQESGDYYTLVSYYTLTFDHNNGTGITEQIRVSSQDVTSAPGSNPVWEGHMFEGWYNDPIVGRQFTFGNPLYADQTLYAHWSADDWKISQWFRQLVRGGNNFSYDADTHTLSIDAGELIFTRHDGSAFNGKDLEAGYYLGFQIQAPVSVTDDSDVYRIEIDGEWYDFNGPNGISNGADNRTGCLYLNIYEPIDMDEIKALADRNALNYTAPSNPGTRDSLIIEDENETGGGRRGRGDSESSDEASFIPELMTWTYRIAKAGYESDSSEIITIKVTLDPRHVQFRDGTDTKFSITGYRYRYRVKFNLVGGTGIGDYNSQIVQFGEQIIEPEAPGLEGYLFDGWYSAWQETITEEIDGEKTETTVTHYADWPYDFEDGMGVRSSFTLYAKWRENVYSWLRAANMTFEGQIRMIVKFTLPNELENYEGWKVTFSNGAEVPFEDAVLGDDGRYAFYCPVPIPEYDRAITISLLDTDNNLADFIVGSANQPVRSYDYSITDYINNKKDDADIGSLVRALDIYGQAAANRFLNGSYTLNLSDITLDAATGTVTTGTKPEGVKVAQNVNFESDNALNIKFTLPEGKAKEDYTFTSPDGARTTVTGQLVKITVPNIAAPNLAKRYTFAISDGTNTFAIETSVLAYAKSIASKGTSSKEDVNLMKALYQYYAAAKAYFN